MKIAIAALIFFLTFTGYRTLTEHTQAIRILHQDNLSTLILLRDISDELHIISKAVANVPVPMPVFERLDDSDPKVACDKRPAPVNDHTPIRKPEIIE